MRPLTRLIIDTADVETIASLVECWKSKINTGPSTVYAGAIPFPVTVIGCRVEVARDANTGVLAVATEERAAPRRIITGFILNWL